MASFGLWAFTHFWNAFGALIVTALHVGLAVLVTMHVLLHKRDVPAAIGWMGLAWLSPIIGPALYWMFGINRVRQWAAVWLLTMVFASLAISVLLSSPLVRRIFRLIIEPKPRWLFVDPDDRTPAASRVDPTGSRRS